MSAFAPEPQMPFTAAEFTAVARTIAPDAPMYVLDAAYNNLSRYEPAMTSPSAVLYRVQIALANAGWVG